MLYEMSYKSPNFNQLIGTLKWNFGFRKRLGNSNLHKRSLTSSRILLYGFAWFVNHCCLHSFTLIYIYSNKCSRGTVISFGDLWCNNMDWIIYCGDLWYNNMDWIIYCGDLLCNNVDWIIYCGGLWCNNMDWIIYCGDLLCNNVDWIIYCGDLCCNNMDWIIYCGDLWCNNIDWIIPLSAFYSELDNKPSDSTNARKFMASWVTISFLMTYDAVLFWIIEIFVK